MKAALLLDHCCNSNMCFYNRPTRIFLLVLHLFLFFIFYKCLGLRIDGWAHRHTQRNDKNNISLGAIQCDLYYSHVTLTHMHSQSSQMSGERLWPCTNSSVSFTTEYENLLQDLWMVQKRKRCTEWPVKIGTPRNKCICVQFCVSVLTLRKWRHE